MSLLHEIPKGLRIRITQNYLECKDGGSNKFYRTLVMQNVQNTDKGHLTVNWGKIGTHGQGRIFESLTSRQCYEDADKRIGGKTAKGYNKVMPNANRAAGMLGNLNSHTFGEDALKDKEALKLMSDTYGGEDLLRQALTVVGAFDVSHADPDQIERDKASLKKKAEQLKAIDEARNSAYSAWGEWA